MPLQERIFRITRYTIFGTVGLICSLFFVILMTALYNYHSYEFYSSKSKLSPRLISQLDYLDYAEKNEAAEYLQRLYPEGEFFFHSLTALSFIYASSNFMKGDLSFIEYKEKALKSLILQKKSISRFTYLEDLNPPYGIFFNGWRAWAIGEYLQKVDSSNLELKSELQELTTFISKAYANSQSPYLESYHNRCWPSDNIIAIASLVKHDNILEKRHSHIVQNWIENVRELVIGNALIPYEVEPKTGKSIDHERGNASAFITTFLNEIDPDFAKAQFKIYKNKFLASRFGLTLVREVPKGEKESGTIDSGPVVFEIGSASTIVSPMIFRCFNEHKIAEKIERSINALGFPIDDENGYRYAFGKMPIADAFLVWGQLWQ